MNYPKRVTHELLWVSGGDGHRVTEDYRWECPCGYRPPANFPELTERFGEHLLTVEAVSVTGAELDKIIASLRTVGGAYVLVAAAVERDNRGDVTA